MSRVIALWTLMLSVLAVLALPSQADAAAFVSISEVTAENDDAAALIQKILGKELYRADQCGKDFMDTRPKKPAIVKLILEMTPEKATLLPDTARDAKRVEVQCVGRALAGVKWPTPSEDIEVTLVLILAPTGEKASSQPPPKKKAKPKKEAASDDDSVDLDEDDVEDDIDLDEDVDLDDEDEYEDDEYEDEDEYEDDEYEDDEYEDDDLDLDDEDDRGSSKQSKDDAKREKQRRREMERRRAEEARAEEERREEEQEREEARREYERRKKEDARRDAERREREEAKAERRREEERRDRAERDRDRDRDDDGDRKGPEWQNSRVGYIAGDIDGELDRRDVAKAFEAIVGKVDKAWRPAKAFHAMVKVRVTVNGDGEVEEVDIVKSRDADDFEDDIADAVEDLELPETDDGEDAEVTWTFAFKR
ncbi:MAG: TonB C-terminal domain-containing protein [Deltaproteobacteria bacterium]|nr:TonB C-terminal domain-containing protein [Deltaproteobacteria bacterium]